MVFLVVCASALAASCLTLFSGFGLGTLLLPAFALFFPVQAAVAMTALVHFSNNLFKLALLGRKADKDALLRFGGPALLASFAGAEALLWLSDLEPLLRYTWASRELSVEPMKLALALLMAGFAAFEVLPGLSEFSFDRKFMPLGGLLSGFFGGLSGHQGALRSAFLARSGLGKEEFIATGVVVACGVDIARLAVYSTQWSAVLRDGDFALLACATLCAFLGAWAGTRLMAKATMRGVQVLVAGLLALVAAGLGSGIL